VKAESPLSTGHPRTRRTRRNTQSRPTISSDHKAKSLSGVRFGLCVRVRVRQDVTHANSQRDINSLFIFR
jgi:hypothetical protein